MDIDPKRTGVKASLIRWGNSTYYEKDRLHGPLGAFLSVENMSGTNWVLCCPGCGQAGSPRAGATWTATQGSFADVTTLTLTPSIQTNCCGWHGYLRGGAFESC